MIIIGVMGPSASGKTTICDKIRENIPGFTTILNLDNFYKPLNPAHNPDEYNFDHPDAFDFERLVNVIQKLQNNETVEVPVYDFTTHSYSDTNILTIKPTQFLIVEGIMTFYDQTLRKLMDFKIYVETDLDECFIRRLKRDISDRGRHIDSIINQYTKFVKPSFEHFINPLKKFADIIIPRGGYNEPAIKMVYKYIKHHVTE